MSVSFGILIKFEDEMMLSRRCGGMWKRFNANGEASIAPSRIPARLTRASIVVAMLGNYNSQCQNPVRICLITVAMTLEEGCAVQNRVPKSMEILGVEEVQCRAIIEWCRVRRVL